MSRSVEAGGYGPATGPTLSLQTLASGEPLAAGCVVESASAEERAPRKGPASMHGFGVPEWVGWQDVFVLVVMLASLATEPLLGMFATHAAVLLDSSIFQNRHCPDQLRGERPVWPRRNLLALGRLDARRH